jgi:hypothetical protein
LSFIAQKKYKSSSKGFSPKNIKLKLPILETIQKDLSFWSRIRVKVHGTAIVNLNRISEATRIESQVALAS